MVLKYLIPIGLIGGLLIFLGKGGVGMITRPSGSSGGSSGGVPSIVPPVSTPVPPIIPNQKSEDTASKVEQIKAIIPKTVITPTLNDIVKKSGSPTPSQITIDNGVINLPRGSNAQTIIALPKDQRKDAQKLIEAQVALQNPGLASNTSLAGSIKTEGKQIKRDTGVPVVITDASKVPASQRSSFQNSIVREQQRAASLALLLYGNVSNPNFGGKK